MLQVKADLESTYNFGSCKAYELLVPHVLQGLVTVGAIVVEIKVSTVMLHVTWENYIMRSSMICTPGPVLCG